MSDIIDHTPGEAPAFTHDSEGILDLCGEMLALLDNMIGASPSLHPMTGRIAELRRRYDALRHVR